MMAEVGLAMWPIHSCWGRQRIDHERKEITEKRMNEGMV